MFNPEVTGKMNLNTRSSHLLGSFCSHDQSIPWLLQGMLTKFARVCGGATPDPNLTLDLKPYNNGCARIPLSTNPMLKNNQTKNALPRTNMEPREAAALSLLVTSGILCHMLVWGKKNICIYQVLCIPVLYNPLPLTPFLPLPTKPLKRVGIPTSP